MQTCSRVVLALFLALHCSGCSLLARWGVIAPRFKVIDQHRQMVGNREFITRRILLNPQTGESILEMREVERPASLRKKAAPQACLQMQTSRHNSPHKSSQAPQ